MTTHFYSASTGGFYNRTDHGDRIPADAVEVSAARHAQLLQAQDTGATIIADNRGRPTLRKQPVAETRARLVAATRREARRRIERISPTWRQINDQRQPSAEGEARFAAIDAIRLASDEIEAAIAAAAAAELENLVVAAHSAWPKED